MATVIDLNADLGEGAADDAALLSIVTSANIATGAHAGGGTMLIEAVRLAVEHGCAVGAHPSYRDRGNFGRKSLADVITQAELAADLAAQALVVAAECERHGVALGHVKAHGALYNDAAADAGLAEAVVDAVVSVQRSLGHAVAVVGLPGSELQHACLRRDLEFRREAFADRRYARSTALVPRSEPGSVLTDPDSVAEQAYRIATGLPVEGIEDVELVIDADTICVHGDTPGAVANAVAVRARLERAGVRVASFVTSA